VSRKTIAFTMPAAGPRRRERTPVDPDALWDEPASLSASDEPGAESDEWVRDRDLRLEFEPARTAAAEASVTLDLAAERNLMEVVSLSFLVPFALGWFWLVNAMSRRYRIWGV
jgi:hypothetical protein